MQSSQVPGLGVAKKKKPNRNIRLNVKDVRVRKTGGKSFAEYLMVVLYRLTGIKTKVTRWEVWRRYSEFSSVDQALRKQYGFNFNSIKFPKKKLFGNLDPVFLRTRTVELNEYLQQVLTVYGVAEFEKPHVCNKELRLLVAFDENSTRKPLSNAQQTKASESIQQSTRRKNRKGNTSNPRRSRRMRQGRRKAKLGINTMKAPQGDTKNSSEIVNFENNKETKNVSKTQASSAPDSKKSNPIVSVTSTTARPRQPGMGNLLAAIKVGKKLRKTKTCDKSKPKI